MDRQLTMSQLPAPAVLARLLLLLVWAGLFGLLLQREYLVPTIDPREQAALKRHREESFMGVYFRGERIGYVKTRIRPGETGLDLDQTSFLRLNVLDKSYPVTMSVEANLDEGSRLASFRFALNSPFYAMKAQGQVEGRRVDFTLATGREEIRDSVLLAREPFFATNRRAYLLAAKPRPGDRLRIPYFDPVSLAGKDTVVEYKGLEKVLIRGRIHQLHHFVETFSGVRISSWLDGEGRVIKEESPAGFVFVAEPEFQATDVAKPDLELLSAVAVPLARPLPPLADLERLRLRLTLPSEAELDLDGGRQTWDGEILTVRRQPLPAADTPACSDQEEALAASPYVQTGAKLLREQAQAVAADAPPLATVQRLAAWVYENIEKRPVIGIPDALTTFDSRQGDCNEHAALFAALARSLGIPTRIVAGVLYMDGAFYYHAWNEVCLGDGWLSLDTTTGQLPADLGHLRLVTGETAELVRIGALIGALAIDQVEEP
ncbi:MAG: transglutaminase-like domain-containing protein [Thermodesulfobacteriota bacterium]